jgi:hypothetical protein
MADGRWFRMQEDRTSKDERSGLFEPEAFEQIPGQLALSTDRTWDGEPLWSADTRLELEEQEA